MKDFTKSNPHNREGLNIRMEAISKYIVLKKALNDHGKLNFYSHQELRDKTASINKFIKKDKVDVNPLQAAYLNGILLISEAIQTVIENYIKQQSGEFYQELQLEIQKAYPEKELKRFFKLLTDNFSYIFESNQLNKLSFPSFFIEVTTLWLNNNNRAFTDYNYLVDDSPLSSTQIYPDFIKTIEEFFNKTPKPDDSRYNLIQFLRRPALIYPRSIQSQLEYIKNNWADLLGDFLDKLLAGLDLIKEENKIGFLGPGPAYVYDFKGDEEYERFSEDSEWMPKLVLIAKSTYVWLEQLSRKYNREINTLDQIPETELSRLASCGFTGIWLIGVWERSKASERIKHINGDEQAIASAYSLVDYRIAERLGGEEAREKLQRKAWHFGIRIACDMVPNHTSLDSDLMVEHPQWFMQLPYSPFPSYNFSGENLSSRSEIETRIEDHYYEKTDAAVVFQLHDRRTGEYRYIYHGNDGTSIPWNDTAQLNYLIPEVREAVIKKIIDIARKFPVIRFDAAMTLAKRHIQRLWFPEPGSGGDIPSRSDYGMTKEKFDQHMPIEFWREVVDRVASEVPDTLLLAEAFWMMEGYFVRTLGMHRVYNSAFMNMLKNEENANYRKSIYNIIEFDADILKRFVNFMSNPDEETAIAQFGVNDKYFGICIMMVTLPGLPMFAHGQIEGFKERYGMEFARARWQEVENQDLIKRHETEIFPLLKKRHIFAEVKNFLLYDFLTPEGYVNEDVFVYSNRMVSESALIIYHNKYAHTRGWINYANIIKPDSDKQWKKIKLAEALELPPEENIFLVFRDHINGLQYLRSATEIHDKGLYCDLGAYKYHVFWEFQTLEDKDGLVSELYNHLQGEGVKDIDLDLKKIKFRKLHKNVEDLFSKYVFRTVFKLVTSSDDQIDKFCSEMFIRYTAFLTEIDPENTNAELSNSLASEVIKEFRSWFLFRKKNVLNKNYEIISLCWLLLHKIGLLYESHNSVDNSIRIIEEKILNEVIFDQLLNFLGNMELNTFSCYLKGLISCDELIKLYDLNTDFLIKILKNEYISQAIGLNEFDGKFWLKEESYENFIPILESHFYLASHILLKKQTELKRKKQQLRIFFTKLEKAFERSGFILQKLIEEYDNII